MVRLPSGFAGHLTSQIETGGYRLRWFLVSRNENPARRNGGIVQLESAAPVAQLPAALRD
jgi:hypothetical protein